MREVSGISGAAPVWHSVMSYLEEGQDGNEPPLAPAGVVAQQVSFSGFNQPSYREWFIAGSEQARVSYLADTVPQILYPVTGVIIALDPDMPQTSQKVFFQAHTGGELLHFWLNDRDLGPALHDYAWQPRRGRYHLVLKTASGQTRADSYFEVRGKLVRH
jgi:penicillin-binding protein 1C